MLLNQNQQCPLCLCWRDHTDPGWRAAAQVDAVNCLGCYTEVVLSALHHTTEYKSRIIDSEACEVILFWQSIVSILALDYKIYMDLLERGQERAVGMSRPYLAVC